MFFIKCFFDSRIIKTMTQFEAGDIILFEQTGDQTDNYLKLSSVTCRPAPWWKKCTRAALRRAFSPQQLLPAVEQIHVFIRSPGSSGFDTQLKRSSLISCCIDSCTMFFLNCISNFITSSFYFYF